MSAKIGMLLPLSVIIILCMSYYFTEEFFIIMDEYS